MFLKDKKKQKITIKIKLLPICIIILILSVVIKLSINIDNAVVLTSSSLMEVVDIAELYTAKFTYNGIASVYRDEEKKNVKYHVRYDAEVKVGVDMKNIQFDVDEDHKKVFVHLPKISIKAIDLDDKMKFLPEGKGWDLQEAYRACQLDVEAEANQSKKLYEIAKTNLEKTIEALTLPLINQYDYELSWDEES